MTGGWIGTFEESWRSEENPKESQEFIWQFRGNASIRSVRLHNNPLCPSKDVALMISNDGKTFEPAWSGTFENVPLDPVKWPKEKGGGASFNFAKVAVFDEPLNARFLKLEIKSGYRPAYWGLDAIEVFGDAPAFIPSPEPFTVSEEIVELEPGPLFVQLITENETGRTEGEIVEVPRPSTPIPLVFDPIVISLSNNIASVRFRTNAMGSWGELSGEINDANGQSIKSTSVSIGKQVADRETILRFENLNPGVMYEGLAIASNENGESEPCKFVIHSEGA